MSKRFLGVEIGGTRLQLVVGGESAQVLERRRLRVDVAQGAGGIRRQIEQTLPEFLQAHPLTGAGIGFSGPVDWRKGGTLNTYLT